MCDQHNVGASAEDNTGQNTKDTHPIPGQKLKFLTPPGIEPGRPGWKAGTLPTTPRRRVNIYIPVLKGKKNYNFPPFSLLTDLISFL